MITEGKGRHAPAPWKYQLSDHELRCILEEATKIANWRQYACSASRWKRGLIGSFDIPGIASAIRSDVAPYVIGLSGEVAVAASLGGSIDTALKKDGDSGADICIGRTRMQVKSRKSDSSTSRDKCSLIKHSNEYGKLFLPTAPIVVFCEVALESRLVLSLGWCKSSLLSALPVVPARRGNHKNVEVRDEELETMNGLKDLIACR